MAVEANALALQQSNVLVNDFTDSRFVEHQAMAAMATEHGTADDVRLTRPVIADRTLGKLEPRRFRLRPRMADR